MSALLDVLGASDGAAAGREGDDDGGCGSTGSPMMTSRLSASLRSHCASLSLCCMIVHSCCGRSLLSLLLLLLFSSLTQSYPPAIGLRVVRATIVAVAAVLVLAAAVVVVSLF